MQHAATPARRGRRPGGSPGSLTKDKVIDAALALLDRQGLAAFSVRDLARALDVFPAAVYWHVTSRNQLLALMVTRVLAGIAPPGDTPLPWQDWLRVFFRRYRDAIRRHPEIAPLIGAQLLSNASIDFALIDHMLAVLEQAGFRGARLHQAYSVVTAAQVGFTTLEFAPLPQDNPAQWAEDMQHLVTGMDRAAHPTLARHLDAMAGRSFTLRWQNGRSVPMDDAFALYVETVIAGLERLAATPQPED